MIGLTPKQKQRIDTLTSYITISLLFVLATVVAVFLVTEINLSRPGEYAELPPVPKVTDITPEELAAERLKLPTYTVILNRDSADQQQSTTASSEGSSRVLSPAEAEALIASESSSQAAASVPPAEPSNNSTSVSYNLGVSVSEQSINTYVATTEEVGVHAVAVAFANAPEGEAPTPQVREGIIFALADDKRSMQVVRNGGTLTEVTLTNQTRYFINGRPLAYESLKVGDIVRIEGSGFPEVGQITADSLAVTGVYELQLSS